MLKIIKYFLQSINSETRMLIEKQGGDIKMCQNGYV